MDITKKLHKHLNIELRRSQLFLYKSKFETVFPAKKLTT